MRYIFSPYGEAAMARFIRKDTLLAFDFDGTLAPIMPLPDAARTPTAICLAMRRLCEIANVAVITGRSVADIRERLDFTPKYIVGNHGAEGLPGSAGTDEPRPDVEAWTRQVDTARDRLPPGIFLEDKGHSLSLHYRTASNREAAKQAIDALVQTLSPRPRVIGGKCVVNLLPANASDKFDALLALQRHDGARNALFIGDDETDESVFRRALPDWLTIRVGHDAPSAAAYCLNSQNEMASLIQRIDSMIRAQRKETA